MSKSPTPVFTGRIINVTVEQVSLPNGSSMQAEIVHHPGGAAVVAIDDNKRVCLLHQYRPVVNDWVWELPAGKTDDHEPPFTTAQRELEEEAGMTATDWQPLGAVLSSPGVFSEVVHLYIARALTATAQAHDEHEVFEIHWLPFDEALAKAQRGDIIDAKTTIGLCRAAALLAES